MITQSLGPSAARLFILYQTKALIYNYLLLTPLAFMTLCH